MPFEPRRGLAAGCALIALAGCGGSTSASRPAALAGTQASFDPLSFTAVSENDFWVLGRVPCGLRRCLTIRRTADGGRTFTRVAAPSLPRATATPLLRFADRRDGFAYVPGVGGALFSTHDGGSTWRRQPLGSVLAFASGGGQALLVTASCPTAACRGYRFRRSPVAADAWTRGRLPFTTDGSILALAAHGPRLWLLGTRAGGRSDVLARSRDGGRTFATGRGPCVPGLGGDVEPVSARVVWAVCPTGMLAGAWRSTDGGIRFARLRTPPLVNSAQLAPASATTAVLARNGASTRILRTTDGGRTWKRPPAPPPAGYASWAGFTDARVGYALVQAGGRQSLWRTTDGGADWYRVRL